MKPIRVLALVGGLALASCTDSSRPPDATSSDLPSGPTLAPPVQPSDCSFKDAQGFNKQYFSSSSIRNMGAEFLRAAEAAAPGSLVRHQNLFEVLKLIAANQGGPAAAGAGLANEAIECSGGPPASPPQFVVTDDRGNPVEILREALTTVTGGAFAFPSGTGFVGTADGGSAVQPVSGTWADVIGGPGIVVGANIVGLTAGATPFQESVQSQSFIYRWLFIYSTLLASGPSGTNDDLVVVEVCATDVFPTGHPPQHRVGRISSTGQSVLQQGDIVGFCPVALSPPANTIARALRGLVGFFAPTPLQARRLMAPPGVTGSTGGLGSDFGVVDPVEVNLTVLPPNSSFQFADDVFPQTYTIDVRLTGANLTPLENVLVTLSASAQSSVLLPPPVTADTDEDGLATLIIILDKPGSYRLELTTDFSGFEPVVLTSNQFNLRPN